MASEFPWGGGGGGGGGMTASPNSGTKYCKQSKTDSVEGVRMRLGMHDFRYLGLGMRYKSLLGHPEGSFHADHNTN